MLKLPSLCRFEQWMGILDEEGGEIQTVPILKGSNEKFLDFRLRTVDDSRVEPEQEHALHGGKHWQEQNHLDFLQVLRFHEMSLRLWKFTIYNFSVLFASFVSAQLTTIKKPQERRCLFVKPLILRNKCFVLHDSHTMGCMCSALWWCAHFRYKWSLTLSVAWTCTLSAH